MPVAPTAIRRATMADVPALTNMFARAFFDDEVAVWACPSKTLRPKMLEGLYRARLRQMLVRGEVWTTPECSSAAIWALPESWKTTIFQDAAMARCLLHPYLLARLPLLAVGLSGVQRRHARTPPHWYLSLLGTDPDVQGQGLGSAVLKPVLGRCDSERVGAYLESSKTRNLEFYGRRGFRTVDELHLPYGPAMWPMWREPDPAP
jgi:ribosomal protein S18 acetylase RimI-like enzyme